MNDHLYVFFLKLQIFKINYIFDGHGLARLDCSNSHLIAITKHIYEI